MVDETPTPPRRPAQLPAIDSRYPVTLVPSPHPATWDYDSLLKRCELRTQRRSGPGGQHRNKTSSGVFLVANDWNIVGEATERRSQAQNRVTAMLRLRYRLAVELRSVSILDAPATNQERELRMLTSAGKLRLSEENPSKPAVLALVLNDMHAAGGQPSLVRLHWKCSTSALVMLLSSHPPALALVNEIRRHHARPPLKV